MNKNITKITLPFDILPQIEGYRPHQDEIQSNLFPNCCEFHENVCKVLQKRFEPDFEIFAKYFEEKSGLKLNFTDYSSTQSKLITQLSYTEYFLAEKIDSPTWFRDFLHYLDYNAYSFGTPSPGITWYFDLVKMYLLNVDDKIEKRKKKLLVAELDYRINSITGKAKFRTYSNSDLIHKTIEKWFNILPFKGKKFKKFIKEDKWDSFAGFAETNQFNDRIITFIPLLNEDLVESLKQLTIQLLSEMNNVERYKKLSKAELENHQFRLDKEKHDLKQKRLLGGFNSNDFSYINILKKWLKNERQFIGKYIRYTEKQAMQSNTFPSGLKTFSTLLSPPRLKKLREMLIASEIISQIEEEDFLYLFKVKPIFQSMTRIDWLAANSWCSDLLKRIVYIKKNRWNSKQVNACIIGKDNKWIATNSYHGEVPEISEILNSIMKK